MQRITYRVNCTMLYLYIVQTKIQTIFCIKINRSGFFLSSRKKAALQCKTKPIQPFPFPINHAFSGHILRLQTFFFFSTRLTKGIKPTYAMATTTSQGFRPKSAGKQAFFCYSGYKAKMMICFPSFLISLMTTEEELLRNNIRIVSLRQIGHFLLPFLASNVSVKRITPVYDFPRGH